MILSARFSIAGGTMRPRALAVRMLLHQGGIARCGAQNADPCRSDWLRRGKSRPPEDDQAEDHDTELSHADKPHHEAAGWGSARDI